MLKTTVYVETKSAVHWRPVGSRPVGHPQSRCPWRYRLWKKRDDLFFRASTGGRQTPRARWTDYECHLLLHAPVRVESHRLESHFSSAQGVRTIVQPAESRSTSILALLIDITRKTGFDTVPSASTDIEQWSSQAVSSVLSSWRFTRSIGSSLGKGSLVYIGRVPHASSGFS